MTPGQWARVLRAGAKAAEQAPGQGPRVAVQALDRALLAMAEEADQIGREQA